MNVTIVLVTVVALERQTLFYSADTAFHFLVRSIAFIIRNAGLDDGIIVTIKFPRILFIKSNQSQ